MPETHTCWIPFMEPPPRGSASRSLRRPPDLIGRFLSLTRKHSTYSWHYFAAASLAFKIGESRIGWIDLLYLVNVVGRFCDSVTLRAR